MKARSDFTFKLQVIVAPDVKLGPGKADLLRGISETGSISVASRRMNMSYKRAWYLVDTLNGYFRSPLVEREKGGRAGGGARLTPLGEEVLKTYDEMVRRTDTSITPLVRQLSRKR